MKRVILHWTAGSNSVSELDLDHYHFIVAGDGTVVTGNFKPEDNESTADNHYAAHTLNCNTGAIGVAVAGMAGAVEAPFNAARYPFNEMQLQAACALTGRLCKRYSIPITPQTVLTHAEVQPTLGIAQRGKWDITRLPWDSSVIGPIPVGNLIRRMVLAPPAEPPTPGIDPRAEWFDAAPPGVFEWLAKIPHYS